MLKSLPIFHHRVVMNYDGVHVPQNLLMVYPNSRSISVLANETNFTGFCSV